MQVTLRKADALQKLIQAAINSTNLVTTVEINRFNSPSVAFEQAKKQFTEDLLKKQALTASLYDIRQSVGSAGANAGVSSILAQMAFIDKAVGMLQSLANVREFYVDSHVLAAQQKDLLEDKAVERYTSRRETVNASILTKDEVESFKKQIEAHRRTRLELSDRLLEINVRTEIELTPDTSAALKQYGII